MKVTISDKGQVVVPKRLRDMYGWTPGTELNVSEADGGVILQAAAADIEDQFPPITVEEFLKRVIKVDKPLPNDEQIQQLLDTEAVKRFNATRR